MIIMTIYLTELGHQEKCVTRSSYPTESNTKVNGTPSQTSEMAKATRSGVMAQFTKASGKMTKQMGRAGLYMLMEIFITAIGRMTKPRALAFTHIMMARGTRGTGRMTSSTAKEAKAGQTVLATTDITLKERKMGLASSNGVIVRDMKASSLIIIYMEKVLTSGPTTEYTKVTGYATKCTAMECSLGMTVVNIKGVMWTTKKKALVSSSGLTADSTTVIGVKANRKVLAYTAIPKAK